MASVAARRAAVGLALAVALLVGVSASGAREASAAIAGSSERARGGQAGRVALLFLPWAGGDRELLRRLGERRELALGLTSPTVGGYSPDAMLLDVGQGARLPLRMYRGPSPRLELRAPPSDAGPGRIDGWARAVARARAAPGAVVPGLFAETVQRAGIRVAYVGPRGTRNAEAAVAARRSGVVAAAEFVGDQRVGAHARARWRRARVLVARLPGDRPGWGALDEVLAARRPSDTVLVVRSPPPGQGRGPLLATGIAGPGVASGAALTSATTRRAGLVAATDVAPSALAGLGVAIPRPMEGTTLRAASGSDGLRTALATLDRLPALRARRPPVLLGLLGAWLLALGALAAARGRAGARTGVRLGLLAALWLPGLALAGAALAPASAAIEAAILAFGSLALAAATDRLLPWPAGAALSTAAVLTAYTVDLAAGSALTAAAVTGPNPAAGARFYGIGNELEALLGVSVLLGVGAGLAAARPRSPRAAASGFALAGVGTAAAMGAGRLGADVGAVITLGAGATVAAAWVLGPRARRLALALAPLAAVGALLALAVLDLATGGEAHLSRSVLDAQGVDAVLEIARRRAAVGLALLSAPAAAALVVVCASALAALAVGRGAVLRPLAAHGAEAFGAGLAGAWAAVVAGALGNDSPPDMLAIGTVLLLLAAGYARAAPDGAGAPPGAATGAAFRLNPSR
ncbi:MAG TPA: hypothetical protein VE528_02620 [Thermoleophilaceae bacterium]|nr:hypothetical protein [Thermoleophilaceae bacterium]